MIAGSGEAIAENRSPLRSFPVLRTANYIEAHRSRRVKHFTERRPQLSAIRYVARWGIVLASEIMLAWKTHSLPYPACSIA
jgi:hypothetical protein